VQHGQCRSGVSESGQRDRPTLSYQTKEEAAILLTTPPATSSTKAAVIPTTVASMKRLRATRRCFATKRLVSLFRRSKGKCRRHHVPAPWDLASELFE